MDRITEALKNLLPADQVSEVATAVGAMMAEARNELEAEYQGKLDEAFAEYEKELKLAESTAETGYKQAYAVIQDLQNRIDAVKEEKDNELEKGFEEAYQMLQEEKNKNNAIEVELYEEFDKKLKDMKDFIVDKVDVFLTRQNAEIYEDAMRHVLTDPRMLEHKVAVEKMAEILSDYMSNDEYSAVTSAKIEETHRAIEELKGQIRVLEARNVRLSTQNNKLSEQIRETQNSLTEATKVERKERVNQKKQASGRGQRVVMGEQILSEYSNPATTPKNNDQDLMEGSDEFKDLLVLSGLEQS